MQAPRPPGPHLQATRDKHDPESTRVQAKPEPKRTRQWRVRGVGEAFYTDVSLGDSVLGEVTSEWSQLEQVSKHPPDVEERLGPDNSQPIDEPLLRDRLHVLTLGVAQMIEA